MIREIIFRGKRIDNSEWIEGSYIHLNVNADFICQGRSFNSLIPIKIEVIPETVGQYTGLTVPSGKIFEHDIVTAKFKSNGARFNFVVKYSNKMGCYVFDNGCTQSLFGEIRSVRIIGNIHDNPELIKEV